MTDNKINILETIKGSYNITAKSFSGQDQKLISETFNLNENSTDEEFEAVGLKKDNFIVIKNKNNEAIKYKNYDNEITKFYLFITEKKSKHSYVENNYYIFFTKKGIIIKDREEEYTKIEGYSGNLAINLISEIFKTKYFLEERKLLYSNLLKYTIQNIGDIDVSELQSLISNNNYDKNREAIDFLMKIIVRSGKNTGAFKFLFQKYFNDKKSKLKLVRDTFAGGNSEMIHILENNFFQQLSSEEKFQFASDALAGACESGKPEVLEYVLDNYSDYLKLEGKENEKSEVIFEAFEIVCTSKNKELFEKFLSEYNFNAIILDKNEEISELFKKIENPEIASLLLNKLLEIGFNFNTTIHNNESNNNHNNDEYIGEYGNSDGDEYDYDDSSDEYSSDDNDEYENDYIDNNNQNNNFNNNVEYGTETILHYAFENENLEIAKLLLNQLSDEKLTELANIKREDELTFFEYNKITRKENLEVAKLLFSIKDFDINNVNTNYDLPIYSAAKNNNIELFKFLLNNPSINVNGYNGYKGFAEYETTLNYIFQREEELDYKEINDNGLLKLLLMRPELKINKNDNEKLIEYLKKSRDIDLNKLIINHPNFNINDNYMNLTILKYFIKKGRSDIVELLLENENLDINEAGENSKNTPLYLAVELKNEDIVKLLVNNDKIDVNKKNELYKTALELTIEKQNEEILRILLSNKDTDVNCIENEKDETLLYYIVSELSKINSDEFKYELEEYKSGERLKKLIDFHKKTISLLLAHKNLDTNLEYNKSYTLLSKTIKNKNIWLTNFLLSQPKIKEDIQKGDGVKLLNKAIEAGNSEIIGLLISKDEINLNTPDENGKTAIQFAISFGKEKILIEAIKNAKELIRNDFNTLNEVDKKIKEKKLELLEEVENEFSEEKQISFV